ncbi:conserved hypothetical protein [Escherichia coli IAI39]|nr:conserved hypothetical protein [Escherichia coli IAI39]
MIAVLCMRSTPYDFIQLIKEVIMPGKTVALPDIDKTLKNARVELKTSPDAKNKLREAAQAVGVDLSAFILSAAMERAESVLDNQRRRELSNQSWELMNQLIAEPAQPTLALKALMKRKNSDGRQA